MVLRFRSQSHPDAIPARPARRRDRATGAQRVEFTILAALLLLQYILVWA